MSQNPSVRTIRESLLAVGHSSVVDPVVVEALRADIVARLDEMRHAMDRAFEFSNRGLVSEAASVVTDFPELAQEADALIELATVDPLVSASWHAVAGAAIRADQLPRRDEIERLAAIAMRADELRPLLDALRLSALRREPLVARMRVLRRLRAEDARNRMWLDQIEALEQEWLRSMAELRSRDATREELDEALVALETHEWVASVPRGLREELFAKVKPLRAEEAGERYQRLADDIHAAASRMDRADILRLEQEWAAVHQETGRMPSDALTRLVTPAFEWLTRFDQEERAQQAFDAEVERLEILLNERRSVVEIEAQVAVLRDAGRATPDGLIERATQYCLAEQERVQRRHRLVLTGSVLAAVVVVAVGALALSLHAAAREREALLATLREAVLAKDSKRLAPLVAEIRTSVVEHGPDLAASLAEADAVLAERARRTEDIRQMLASAEKELAGTPSRARVEVLRQALATAMKDAEDGDRPNVQRVDAQRVAALEALDAKATEEATNTIAAIDQALLPWPVPDAWKDSDVLDESRWSAYVTALEGLRGQLDGSVGRVDGHDASLSRLGIKRDAIEQRLGEAKARLEALRLAVRELSNDKLLAPVSSERQFVERLENALKTHGPVLARRGQLTALEQSLACGDAYRAMEVWRSELRPKLSAALGPTLANRPTPEVAAQVVSDIRAFIGAHPAAPMRDVLSRMADDMDPNSGAEVWSPHRLELELAAEFLSSIEEVPLVDGRRFYRRPSVGVNPDGSQKSPLTRALKTLADVPTDPDKLSAILAVQSSEIKGKPFVNPISEAWARAQASLGSCQSHEVTPVMLTLYADITNAKSTDPLLRCRALREAARSALDSGHIQGKLREELQKWQSRCRAEFAAAMTADWVAAGYDKDFIAWRKTRTEATNAIAAFPDTAVLRVEIERASRRLGDALTALVPVGVLGSAEDGSRTRVAQVSGAREDLFILIRGAPLWLVTPITVENGQVQSVPDGAPSGPVLIYRRNRS